MSRKNRRQVIKVASAGVVSGIGVPIAGCMGSETKDNQDKKLVAGTAPGFPPFEMKKDGELVGLDIDLMEAVIEETSYSLDGWEEYEFKSLIPALVEGKIDVIGAALTITEEREEKIDFTNPYFNGDQAVLVSDSGSFDPASLNDLIGYQVSAQRGTTGEQLIKDELINPGNLSESNYSAYDSFILAVKDLERGTIDAVIVDSPVAQTFTGQYDVEVAYVHETGGDWAFAVPNNDDELLSEINEGIAKVEQNGTFGEIKQKWFASNGSTS